MNASIFLKPVYFCLYRNIENESLCAQRTSASKFFCWVGAGPAHPACADSVSKLKGNKDRSGV